MKKITAIIIAALMTAVCITGCGSKPAPTTAASSAKSESAAASSASSAAEASSAASEASAASSASEASAASSASEASAASSASEASAASSAASEASSASSASTEASSASSEASSAASEASSASSVSEASSASSTASSSEDFTFKHGFDLDYPPYSFIDDEGKIGGFDVEMAQAVCDYYGWKYEAVPFNWDAKDAELNAGSCDCIWSGFTINGREDDYLWSKAYSDNTQMIMVKKDAGIESLADLKGKNVGVQTSTSAYDLLNDEEGQLELKNTFADLKVYETYTIAFNDLKAGAIDAIAIDVTSGNYLMSDETDYVYLEEALGSEQYGIGFRKDDTELCEKVNAALDALVENGTYEEIGKKYPEIYDYLCLGK